jgi:hypothetical protein
MNGNIDLFAGLSGDADGALADPGTFNRAYAAACEAAPLEGHLKNASALHTEAIKLRLREKPFARAILPPKNVNDTHIDRSLDHDLPRIIEDMEPAFRKPRVVPFGQPPETTPSNGQKFEVVFYELQSPEFIFQIDRLKTYRMDLRQLTTDAMLMDLGELEDKCFLSLTDRVNGQASGVGLSGVQQHSIVDGAITRSTWKNVASNLGDRLLNLGVTLMNRRTSREFEGWDHDQLGGPLAEKVFTEGSKAFSKFTPGGLPTIVTINNHLVPNGWVYQFTEPAYLGRFYIWSDVSVYVERKRDFIRQSASQKIGITLANVNGTHLTRFLQMT